MKDTILDLVVYGLVIFTCTYLGAGYALMDFTNTLIELEYLR